MELAFFRTNFGDVDVKISNWIFFEFLFCRLISFDLWQTADPVTLIAAMQGSVIRQYDLVNDQLVGTTE